MLLDFPEHSALFGSPIATGLTLTYTAILGSTLTLELDGKLIVTICGVVLANFIGMLRWGLKVEKSLVRFEEGLKRVEEKIEQRNTEQRGKEIHD